MESKFDDFFAYESASNIFTAASVLIHYAKGMFLIRDEFDFGTGTYHYSGSPEAMRLRSLLRFYGVNPLVLEFLFNLRPEPTVEPHTFCGQDSITNAAFVFKGNFFHIELFVIPFLHAISRKTFLHRANFGYSS